MNIYRRVLLNKLKIFMKYFKYCERPTRGNLNL